MNENAQQELAEIRSLLNVLMLSLPKGKKDTVHLPANDLIHTLQIVIDKLDRAIEQ